MQHVFVPYKVRPEAIEKAKTAIVKFITEIRANEPGTLFYKSLQNSDSPTDFVHVMAFSNDEAEQFHKKSAYCREFTDVLYPLCEVMPKPIAYYEVV